MSSRHMQKSVTYIRQASLFMVQGWGDTNKAHTFLYANVLAIMPIDNGTIFLGRGTFWQAWSEKKLHFCPPLQQKQT